MSKVSAIRYLYFEELDDQGDIDMEAMVTRDLAHELVDQMTTEQLRVLFSISKYDPRNKGKSLMGGMAISFPDKSDEQEFMRGRVTYSASIFIPLKSKTVKL